MKNEKLGTSTVEDVPFYGKRKKNTECKLVMYIEKFFVEASKNSRRKMGCEHSQSRLIFFIS